MKFMFILDGQTPGSNLANSEIHKLIDSSCTVYAGFPLALGATPGDPGGFVPMSIQT